MRRRAHSVFRQLPLVLFCSLVSIATGTLCIALVALYHQEEAVLIVIACSSIINGFLFIPFTIFLKKNHSQQILFVKFLSILSQLTILGAAIEYFNYTTKHAVKIKTHVHKNLLIGLDSLLLCSFAINGFILGCPKEPIDNSGTKESEPGETKPFDEKTDDYIPLKNSAQTLIPEVDTRGNIRQTPGGNSQPGSIPADLAASAEDATSNSVAQRGSPFMNAPGLTTLGNNIIRKTPELKSAVKKKKSFIFKFTSSKEIKKVGVEMTALKKRRNSTSSVRQNANGTVSTKYECRLPTIPDYSRSILNLGTSQKVNSQNDDTQSAASVSGELNPRDNSTTSRHLSSEAAIERERNEIKRIDSTLLPPCHKISDPLGPTLPPSPLDSSDFSLHNPTPLTPTASNSIERNGLEDIPQVPQLLDDTASNFLGEREEQEELAIDIPQNVTLETWERDKEIFLKRAACWQRRNRHNNQGSKDENSQLLPALAFGNGVAPVLDVPDRPPDKGAFRFPLQKSLEIQNKFEDNNDDTISALEEYFKDIRGDDKRESHVIQNGLQFNDKSYSNRAPRFSRDSHRSNDRHSPTKSIISIISGRDSLGGVQRSQTILTNNNISGERSCSPSRSSLMRSSPTRSQILRRMGKKLSLSNISDTMINTSGNPENNNEFKAHLKYGHAKGKSVDFSYIHSLQSNHSPNKSFSGFSSRASIYRNRRSSIAADSDLNFTDNADINTSIGVNTDDRLKRDMRTAPTNGPEIDHIIPSRNRDSSTESSQDSAASTTNYPDIVMSEYDRERWNVLLSLRMVNSGDHLKEH